MTRFNLVVLLTFVFALGCNGQEFTSGLFNGDATDAGDVRTDSAPFLAAGGAPVAATGGASQGSGGSSHGSGGSFQETDGSSHGTGGAPGTGGVVSTGGGSGGSVVVDACAPVTHDNGFGQTWGDCVPLGTYNREQAMKACKASGAPRCVFVTFCGVQGSEICGQDAAGAQAYAGCWGYDSDVAGRFTDTPTVCPVDDASSTGKWN